MQTTTFTVGDIAHTAISTTSATTTLRAAATELAGEHRGILLVTGNKGLIGIVSERDITRAIGEGEDPDQLRVEDVMTEDVVTIGRAASMPAALAKMDEHQIRHLVVAQGGAPVGVVSLRDVAHALLGAASVT